MKNCRNIVILFSFLIVNTSYAQIYKWTDEHGRTQFSDKPHPDAKEVNVKGGPGKKQIASAPTQTKVVTARSGNTVFPDSVIPRLRTLLEHKKFKQLNKDLHQLQLAYESNDLNEPPLFTAYDAFSISHKKFQPLFDSWVTTTPKAYQPYLARAKYYYDLGWSARGGRWASETEQKQMNEMSAYFKKASDDLMFAIERNPKTIVPYYTLMGIMTTLGRDDETERLMRKALKIKPASFNIRSKYLNALKPRWGGSIDKMKTFIDESLLYSSKNPKLNLLEGFVYAEAGDMQVTVRKHNVAITLYSKSLEYGDYHYTLYKRGKSLFKREKYQEALDDFNRAIKLQPDSSLYYYRRALTYIDMKKYNDALKDIHFAYQLDPYDEDILYARKWLAANYSGQKYDLQQSVEVSDEVEKYNLALEKHPDNASFYYERSKVHMKERNIDQALDDIKKAIELDPNEINYTLLIDYILARNSEWGEVIKYWNRFIKLNPDNSQAYLEISGTYYHNGDLESAVENAKISANLGNHEGMVSFRKFYQLL